MVKPFKQAPPFPDGATMCTQLSVATIDAGLEVDIGRVIRTAHRIFCCYAPLLFCVVFSLFAPHFCWEDDS